VPRKAPEEKPTSHPFPRKKKKKSDIQSVEGKGGRKKKGAKRMSKGLRENCEDLHQLAATRRETDLLG